MKTIYRAGALSLVALSLTGGTASAQTVTLLYSFSLDSSKGKGQVSDLIADEQGALYGTTEEGGADGYGTIFKLTPPATGESAWTETVLYSFTGYTNGYDGEYPMAGLVAGSDGALYGTTNGGGLYSYGTVFKLTPPKSGGAPWTEQVLYNFCSVGEYCIDGKYPQAGLIIDQQGVLYGTTTEGGSYDYGAIFKVTPAAYPGGPGTETVLFSFCSDTLSCADGDRPLAGLIADQQGALYGTTEEGGADGYGTIFKLTPPTNGKTAWTETVLHSFAGGGDGAYPRGGLVASPYGGFFGSTSYGGTNCDTIDTCGTVFELTPPGIKPFWTNKTLHSFGGSPPGGGPRDGSYPVGRLTYVEKDGALYGTTEYGGFGGKCGWHACGTIFKLTAAYDWGETVIHRFCDLHYDHLCETGAYPEAGLLAYKGALYGTTSYQGEGAACNCGTVFKLDF